jgi:HSP20 family protein
MGTMAKNGQVALVRRGSDALARRMEPLEDFVIPAVDIYETSDTFVLKVDLPGVPKESIDVHIEPGILQIKGYVTEEYKQNVNLLYSEIRRASYFRKFNIGKGIDADSIDARYDDGVLTVMLPKNESMRAREIPIK